MHTILKIAPFIGESDITKPILIMKMGENISKTYYRSKNYIPMCCGENILAYRHPRNKFLTESWCVSYCFTAWPIHLRFQ